MTSTPDYPSIAAQIRRTRTATRGKLAHLATLRRMRLETMKREIKRSARKPTDGATA